MRTQNEIEELLDDAYIMDNFAGMSYKEGIIATLEYVLGIGSDDKPTE